MRAFCLGVLLALAGLSSGCLVTTLQPVYDDTSLEFDEGLAGRWQAEEQGATVAVERGEWKSYRITYSSRNTSYVLIAYLTKIGGSLFLDVTPAQGLEAGPLLVPVHAVGRLQREGDTVTVMPLDYDWFAAPTRSKTLTTLQPAVDGRQNVLLTAKTGAVRAWLLAHVKTADAFREPMTFTRTK